MDRLVIPNPNNMVETTLGHLGRVTYLSGDGSPGWAGHADMEFVCDDGKLPCHRCVCGLFK